MLKGLWKRLGGLAKQKPSVRPGKLKLVPDY
jgi:hypothetical protein